MTVISICEITGATWGEYVLSGASLGGTRGRFCTADKAASSNIGTNYPIPVPTSGYNNSYAKSIFLKATSFTDTKMYNFRFYTDGGGYDTGVETWVGQSGQTDASKMQNGLPSSQYTQATGTEGTSGDLFWDIGGHYYSGIKATGVVKASANAFSFTSASPLWLTSGNSTNILDSDGYSFGVAMQVRVDNSANSGTYAAENYTIKYDVI